MCSCDAAYCQIALTTCYYYTYVALVVVVVVVVVVVTAHITVHFF